MPFPMLLRLWRPIPFVALTVMLCLVLAVGEFSAQYVEHSHSVFDATGRMHGHVAAAVRSFALPNYWVWYDGVAVFEALDAQRGGEYAFLVHTVYNCAVATGYVAAWLCFVTMFIAVRALPFGCWPSHVVGWVPLVAFVFDAAEDVLLVHLTLADPDARPAWAARAMAWCSLAKFVGWGVTLATWPLMLAAWPFKDRLKRD